MLCRHLGKHWPICTMRRSLCVYPCQVDSDTFYIRYMAKQARKTLGGVNLLKHKRG